MGNSSSDIAEDMSNDLSNGGNGLINVSYDVDNDNISTDNLTNESINDVTNDHPSSDDTPNSHPETNDDPADEVPEEETPAVVPKDEIAKDETAPRVYKASGLQKESGNQINDGQETKVEETVDMMVAAEVEEDLPQGDKEEEPRANLGTTD